MWVKPPNPHSPGARNSKMLINTLSNASKMVWCPGHAGFNFCGKLSLSVFRREFVQCFVGYMRQSTYTANGVMSFEHTGTLSIQLYRLITLPGLLKSLLSVVIFIKSRCTITTKGNLVYLSALIMYMSCCGVVVVIYFQFNIIFNLPKNLDYTHFRANGWHSWPLTLINWSWS